MKTHSTNYFDTFIEVAEDTKADRGIVPPAKDIKTVAGMHYDLLSEKPYKYTSDDIFFLVFAKRSDLAKANYKQAREQFFSKGQPCFRASPLTKTYGFGIHSDKDGKVALYGMETEEYQEFLANNKIRKVKAMKSRR
ncbi:MAG: hypothetical protein JNM41_12765 [Flavipsychrobacter sp.]|nr:hypothetical protein [Flavipsychrobacter sp.]